MITEEKRKEVLAAIERMDDETALQQIVQLLKLGIAPKPRAPLGFARGDSGIWMADDFDAPLEDFADYM